MRLRLTSRVVKLENKRAGPKDHFRFVNNDAEANEARAWYAATPYAKLPGHTLWIIRSPLPPKDPNL